MPRFLTDIFTNLKHEPSLRTIRVSFLEIYCDTIRDLLDDRADKQLVIRDDPHNVWVENLRQLPVESLSKALELMNIGRSRQATGANALNDTSSRSHAIYTMEITRKFHNESKKSKLTFVDLAGSERLKKTLVEGAQKRESIQINGAWDELGLLALGNVINALADEKLQQRRKSREGIQIIAENGSSGRPRSPRATSSDGFIPYRSSKLTRLLRDALGGNSHTLFIACVSPADSHAEETLGTLQYANRVRNIHNKAEKHIEADQPVLSSSQIEINRLQDEISRLTHRIEELTSAARIREEESAQAEKDREDGERLKRENKRDVSVGTNEEGKRVGIDAATMTEQEEPEKSECVDAECQCHAQMEDGTTNTDMTEQPQISVADSATTTIELSNHEVATQTATIILSDKATGSLDISVYQTEEISCQTDCVMGIFEIKEEHVLIGPSKAPEADAVSESSWVSDETHSTSNPVTSYDFEEITKEDIGDDIEMKDDEFFSDTGDNQPDTSELGGLAVDKKAPPLSLTDLHDLEPQEEVCEEPITRDFVVLRSLIRDATPTQRMASPRRTMVKASPSTVDLHVHPMKLFALDECLLSPMSPSDHLLAQAQALSQNLLELTTEDYGASSGDEDDSSDNNAAQEHLPNTRDSMAALISTSEQLLRRRRRQRLRVSQLRRQIHQLEAVLGVPTKDRLRNDDPALRAYTLRGQVEFLTPILHQYEVLAAARLQARLSARVEAELLLQGVHLSNFLDEAQCQACSDWFFSRRKDLAYFRSEILPLLLAGWISVAPEDLEAEEMWLRL
ncbi:hypothetical protein Poli38472_009336 [Pythium oligandrum]|uniref:Kinesin-like protein n=1 Tax=Pythium oligandrum TaxID=41045 RepID=A0A8K1CKF2_PYTOL|nr:hypothetical protein Poli38472_009336 [Pythium oligandrum]|eukprot:TMW65169.1 hypothetical protein Poli38472_009336 [Pythium oligandrum]